MDKSYILQSINLDNLNFTNNSKREAIYKKFGNPTRERALEEATIIVKTLNEYEEIFESSAGHLYNLNAYENNDKYITSDIYDKLENIDNMDDYLYESVKEVVQSAKHKYKKKEEAVDRAVADKIRKMNDDIKNDIREQYVERIPMKLSKIVKMALAAGAAWAINPAIAVVGSIVALARSKKVNARERDRLISEIREERAIVEEKIKDADSNADKKEKYQLMRLKISLDRAEKRLIMGKNA